MTDTTHDDDFYPATAGDDPIWLGGVEYITKSRSDDLVQAAVAAKLREAAAHIAPHPNHDRSDWTEYAHQAWRNSRSILAFITPDAQAALDRVVAAEREHGFWAGKACGGSKAQIDAAVAIIRAGNNVPCVVCGKTPPVEFCSFCLGEE